MSRHLMLVPSLACPASCAYCFGPHAGGPSMRQETVEAVVRWQNSLGDKDALEITFHGGEPLVPGIQFYRMALPLLREGLALRRARFAMQSNLWLLTDDLCDLLREYGVSIGTSLDGPEPINDAQRGQGYFARTMASIERARAHGINVGCICTFTTQSVPHAGEIFDFFVREGLNFTVHAAVPSLRYPDAGGWTLSTETHGGLLVNMLDRYLANVDKIRISTLDSICRSVSAGHGGICTFGDCMGGYLAVGPDGEIYPCQRFAGMPEYQLGNVHGRLSSAPRRAVGGSPHARAVHAAHRLPPQSHRRDIDAHRGAQWLNHHRRMKSFSNEQSSISKWGWRMGWTTLSARQTRASSSAIEAVSIRWRSGCSVAGRRTSSWRSREPRLRLTTADTSR
jgi:uncharacterized protein